MSFTIYTAGDATFLTEVFNSVAMVSGSGAIASVAAVGALVTVILLGFRAILEGGRAIRFEELLLGFVVYMIAFYPTTTVLVEAKIGVVALFVEKAGKPLVKFFATGIVRPTAC